MAPASTGELPVHGTRQERGSHVLLFVLDERLTGHPTFLTATLVVDDATTPRRLQVRILTFDDVTVLSPLPGQTVPAGSDGQAFTGTLMLPHGWRTPLIPHDLARAAAAAGIDTGAWSEPEARQLLTFLGGSPRGQPGQDAADRGDHLGPGGAAVNTLRVRLVSLDVGYTSTKATAARPAAVDGRGPRVIPSAAAEAGLQRRWRGRVAGRDLVGAAAGAEAVTKVRVLLILPGALGGYGSWKLSQQARWYCGSYAGGQWFDYEPVLSVAAGIVLALMVSLASKKDNHLAGHPGGWNQRQRTLRFQQYPWLVARLAPRLSHMNDRPVGQPGGPACRLSARPLNPGHRLRRPHLRPVASSGRRRLGPNRPLGRH